MMAVGVMREGWNGVRGLVGRSVRGGQARLSGGLLLLAELATDLGALQDALAVLVELELGDDDVAGVQGQGDALARDLLAGDALDVDGVLEAVHRRGLTLTALHAAAHDRDLV